MKAFKFFIYFLFQVALLRGCVTETISLTSWLVVHKVLVKKIIIFFDFVTFNFICLKLDIEIPEWMGTLFNWLGWANSALNPVIYATLNRDFRKPFREILYFRCATLDDIMRRDFYHQHYGDDLENFRRRRFSSRPHIENDPDGPTSLWTKLTSCTWNKFLVLKDTVVTTRKALICDGWHGLSGFSPQLHTFFCFTY